MKKALALLFILALPCIAAAQDPDEYRELEPLPSPSPSPNPESVTINSKDGSEVKIYLDPKNPAKSHEDLAKDFDLTPGESKIAKDKSPSNRPELLFSSGQLNGDLYHIATRPELRDEQLSVKGLSVEVWLFGKNYSIESEAQFILGNFKAQNYTLQAERKFWSPGPINFHIGLRYAQMNEDEFYTDQPNVKVNLMREKYLGLGALGLGIGNYNRFSLRASWLIGGMYSHSYVRVRASDFSEFREPLAEATGYIQGLSFAATARPIRQILLTGNYKYLWNKSDNHLMILPDSEKILEGSATVMSPFGLGLKVKAGHTNDRRGLVFLSDYITYLLFIKF
jgi:hypothetical protein